MAQSVGTNASYIRKILSLLKRAAIIDGLRGIYAAGVLDYCMEHDIRFDLGIGVSAGSANLASYAAGQIGRNYKFYTEYAFRRQYMGIGNFIFKHSFIDNDYVYGTLCRADGEYPLDYPSLREASMIEWRRRTNRSITSSSSVRTVPDSKEFRRHSGIEKLRLLWIRYMNCLK